MKKRFLSKYDIKEILVAVLFLIVGIGLTVMSFCVYYLVKPLHFGVLIVICAIDFAYAFIQLCVLFNHAETVNKWLLKAILFTVGYIALFIVAAVLFVVFNDAATLLSDHIVDIVYYAFFTAPCMFIVVAIIILCLAYGG